MKDLTLSSLIKSRIFIGAYLVVFFAFFVVTISILNISGPGYGAGTVEYGFPFTYYDSRCFGENSYPLGLLGNILFAALIGTIVGIFCAYVWKTLASEDFRKKWNL